MATDDRHTRTEARPTRQSVASGLLLVNKPQGLSSARVVAVVKRALGGPKLGHLGTLDPFASGLLPLCVGEGTKLAPYLNTADKSYVGTVLLGVTTDTLDCTGRPLATSEPPPLEQIDLQGLAREFTGCIEQVPPAYSAIKRGGVRMYELARRGEAPELEARPVSIHQLCLARVDERRIRLSVSCSKGTYVRSLARDLGERLGCGGTLESLVRTRFGRFDLQDALPLASIEVRGAAAAQAALISPARALEELPALAVSAEDADGLRSGRQRVLEGLAGPHLCGELARVLDPCGRLIAIVAGRGPGWRIDRIFHS